MKLTKLRIVGFKSFVEPTDVRIEPGLTGVIGPNGCGKSNLVEALRWAMGESSHKNMRASGMDDVIFGGSTARAARNTAEVVLHLDNADRAAPAAFNDADHLEISRRIERAHGSHYRVNGREVRARDVQLLFADAATGARSPALVKQGQIAELIAAKPQARRRILEDAAGTAGLAARRHEAEIRLKGAEDNLLRVKDVLREIDGQVEALRRQVRRVARYRGLSAEIRKLEARLAWAAWRAAEGERMAAEETERADVRAVAERTAEQAEAARRQAIAVHEVGPLRDAQAGTGAALRRLLAQRAELDAVEARAAERRAALTERLAELARDADRQAQSRADAAETLARLGAEMAERDGSPDGEARRTALAIELATAEAELVAEEAALAAAQAAVADLSGRRSALAREEAAETERAERAGRELTRLRAERNALAASGAALSSEPLREAVIRADAGWTEAERDVERTRRDLAAARNHDAAERDRAAEAERAAQRLETELHTLRKLFPPGRPGDPGRKMIDVVRVEPGCEIALAAALGDDLDASPDPAAPLRWTDTGSGPDDPPLPPGIPTLADVVSGSPALARRLRQVGLVTDEVAAEHAGALRPGQRLVTRAGALWRWDGLAATADAPSPAARRLVEKNRLDGLDRSAVAARELADTRRTVAASAAEAVQGASRAEDGAVEAARQARRRLDDARDALARIERKASEGAARLSALTEAVSRVEAGEGDARRRVAAAVAALAALPDPRAGETRTAEQRAVVASARQRDADARASLAALTRELESARRRKDALRADIRLWTDRSERAAAAGAELAARTVAARHEMAELEAAPETFVHRRRVLATAIREADARSSEASDRLAAGERRVGETDRAARAALDALAASRERRAASEVRSEALARRVAEMTGAIAAAFSTDPAGLRELAGAGRGVGPDVPAAETRLATLRADRERLGGVNLRAEEELNEGEAKRDRLVRERDDLSEAIKRLRQAIATLNRDGRERLLAAFGVVDGHFRRLFGRLFGGGEAELALVDSDDPLAAGIEITARPPGKKPQTLSLLSGGEQALTATALIFAVFLTNPSPICVLDEVDAPLDDANVERYCDLLHGMAADTDTRFIVITHNPITMARMDRLYGITMAERGISQLVSVDLGTAERLREAV